MSTDHCPDCEPGNPCGGGHLYVIEFSSAIREHFEVVPDKGMLYVGSTSKSVEERWLDNLTRSDGTVLDLEEARAIGEDGNWKYKTPATKRLRLCYERHRPDLYFKHNPITYRSDDPGQLVRREEKLAKKLENRGWRALQG